MKGKKKTLTRKGLTLRLGAWAAALVLLACLSGLYTPFPRQTLSVWEREFSTGPLETIQTETFGHRPAYLAGNENALTLTFCRYDPIYGWGHDSLQSIDLSQREPPVCIRTTLYSPEHDDMEEGLTYDQHFFGRVDVEGAAAIQVRFPWGPAEDDVEDAITIPLFQGEDGRTYFWAWRPIIYSNDFDTQSIHYLTPLDVEVLDREGNILSTHHIIDSV